MNAAVMFMDRFNQAANCTFGNSAYELNGTVLLSGGNNTQSLTFTIGSITGGDNWSPSLGSFGVLRKDGSTTEESVYLTWTPIPEPGAALLGGLGMLALLRRRHIA